MHGAVMPALVGGRPATPRNPAGRFAFTAQRIKGMTSMGMWLLMRGSKTSNVFIRH